MIPNLPSEDVDRAPLTSARSERWDVYTIVFLQLSDIILPLLKPRIGPSTHGTNQVPSDASCEESWPRCRGATAVLCRPVFPVLGSLERYGKPHSPYARPAWARPRIIGDMTVHCAAPIFADGD